MSQTRMITRSQAATATNICPGCGVTVRPKETPKGAFYLSTYCSRQCSGRARVLKPFEHVCEFCRKPFDVPRVGASVNRPRRFCSKACADQASAKPHFTRKRHGYLTIWTGKAEVLWHRIVMEHTLGRLLTDTETVHHINGHRDDNRPENLELWDHAQPHGQRVPDKLAWCAEYLTAHGYTVIAPTSAP